MARGCIPVDQPFSSRPVEQCDSRNLNICSSVHALRLFQRRTESRALGAIAHHRSAGFTHVFLRGRYIRHLKSLLRDRIAGEFPLQ